MYYNKEQIIGEEVIYVEYDRSWWWQEGFCCVIYGGTVSKNYATKVVSSIAGVAKDSRVTWSLGTLHSRLLDVYSLISSIKQIGDWGWIAEKFRAQMFLGNFISKEIVRMSEAAGARTTIIKKELLKYFRNTKYGWYMCREKAAWCFDIMRQGRRSTGKPYYALNVV